MKMPADPVRTLAVQHVRDGQRAVLPLPLERALVDDWLRQPRIASMPAAVHHALTLPGDLEMFGRGLLVQSKELIRDQLILLLAIDAQSVVRSRAEGCVAQLGGGGL